MTQLDRLDVTVSAPPNPGLLRPSIEAAIRGRPLAEGPEAAIGRAVRDAVRGLSATEGAAS